MLRQLARQGLLALRSPQVRDRISCYGYQLLWYAGIRLTKVAQVQELQLEYCRVAALSTGAYHRPLQIWPARDCLNMCFVTTSAVTRCGTPSSFGPIGSAA